MTRPKQPSRTTPDAPGIPARRDGRAAPFVVHDERAFMQECADRLNAFLATYPDEAQHVLATHITYAHELVVVHKLLERSRGTPASRKPGVSVAALFAALLQTHRGTGFVLKPLILPAPDAGPGCCRIEKFLVVEQDEDQVERPSG